MRQNEHNSCNRYFHTILKTGGQTAVVLPDNVLFEGETGETIRKKTP
nr:N-6 DNA methylase [Methanosarcina horonobensis]